MKSNVKKRRNTVAVIFITVILIFLVAYALSMLGILSWGFLTSLKSRRDFGTINSKDNNIFGLPNWELSKKEILFGNYKSIYDSFSKIERKMTYYSGYEEITHEAVCSFMILLRNTLLYAGLGSIISAVVPAVVAYVCVKYPFRFSKILYSVAMITYIVPIVGNYPSVLATLKNLQLYDTFIGNYIQKFNFSGMYFFVYWAFFEGISNTYIEAAEIDGASDFRIMISIMLPLSVKIIASVALILFIQNWNDYQTVNLYLYTKPTLAFGVWYLTNKGKLSSVPLKVAGGMIIAIPITILFIVFKDKLMGNMTMGGIKE